MRALTDKRNSVLMSSQVSNNGDISFGRAFGGFSPESFPLNDSIQLIAPFWADVDTRTRGNVYYREVNTSTETETVMRVESEVRCLFSDHMDFRADLIFIATWVNVSFFGGFRSPLVSLGGGYCSCENFHTLAILTAV